MSHHTRTMFAALIVAGALAGAYGAGADAAAVRFAAAPSTAVPTSNAETTAAPPAASGPGTEGTVVLTDTFDDDTNGWSPESLDDEFATGVIADGVMSFSQSTSYLDTLPEGRTAVPLIVWPSLIEPIAESLTDVRMEATVALTTGAAAGFACGVDPTNERQSAYFVGLSSAGIVTLNKFGADGRFDKLAQIPEMPADGPAALPADPAFDYDPATAYRLAAECRLGSDEAEITLELDGEVLLTVVDDDDPIASGIVGVYHGESSLLNEIQGFQPYGVVFDDVVITELPDAGSAEPAAPFKTFCTDDTGDQRDDKGNPLGGVNESTDLVGASLASDGTTLVATYELAAAPPTDSAEASDRLRWVTTLSTPDRRIVIETIRVGTEFRAQLAEPARGHSVDLLAELTGSRLTVSAPLDALEIPSVFDWTAYTEWYPLEGPAARVDDVCPDDGHVTVD